MSDVFNLIDEMEGYFEECKSVPFSNKIVVDMEVIYEFMTDLRLKMPEEIKRSQRILDEKERIIDEARKDADQAESRAAARVDELVNEHVISKKAEKRAEEIIAEANETAKEIKLGAYDYVEELVDQIEMAMRDTIEQSNHHYAKFEQYIDQQIRVVSGNKEELQASRNHIMAKDE